MRKNLLSREICIERYKREIPHNRTKLTLLPESLSALSEKPAKQE